MSAMNELHQTITELLESGQHTLFEIAVIVGIPMGMVRDIYDLLMVIEELEFEYV